VTQRFDLLGKEAWAALTVDLNQDSKPDVVTSNSDAGAGSINVLINSSHLPPP